MTDPVRVLLLLTWRSMTMLVAGCQSRSARSDGALVRDGVFIHLTKGPEDPHAVAMQRDAC